MKLRFAWKPLLVQSQIMGLIVLAQFQTNMWTTQQVQRLTIDRMFLYFLLFAAVNFAVVYVGNRLARRGGQWKRRRYLAIGAVAATAAHAVALAPGAYVDTWRNGVVLLLIFFPALLGAATAYLMHLSLGYADDGDDPHALASEIAGEGSDSNAAVHDIGTAAYYEGPLQVRTSSMAAVVAAFVGSAIYALTVMFSLTDGLLPDDAMPPLYHDNPALMALMAIGFYAIFFYVFIRKAHAFLQARGKDKMLSYALAGVFVPMGFAAMLLALMGPFGIMVVLPWVVPSVVAMVSYHRHAGFEPLALPRDIEVGDPRTMLPADHIRRRVERIIPVD
jgi:fatty acid desaturase